MEVKLTGDQLAGPIRMAIFGLSGAGKTMLSASAPAPIVVNAEKGLMSLSPANIAAVYGEGQDWVTYNVPYVDAQSLDGLKAVYAWLQTDAAKVYQTVIIDSASDIAEEVLATALANPELKDPRQAYGILGNDVTNIIRKFRDLPTHHHIVFLCKAEKYTDDVTGATSIGMKFPGKMLQSAVPYLLDEVLYLEVTPQGRQIRAKANWQAACKDRSGKLDELEYPSLTHIFAKMGAY